jgi:hypothetical protein
VAVVVPDNTGNAATIIPESFCITSVSQLKNVSTLLLEDRNVFPVAVRVGFTGSPNAIISPSY